MKEEQTAKKVMCGARLACFALWGVLTLMATAALVRAVPVAPQTNTAATPVVTE